jgi:tartrate dehydratase alpha subunit/fumarate hydratase class I-like protein
MSDQDSVHVTERLERIRIKQSLILHAQQQGLPIKEGTADLILRGVLLALARKIPAVLICTGISKTLDIYTEIVIEELMAKLNSEEQEEEKETAENEGKEEEESCQN